MPSKRNRACDACHSIKIKCELGAIGGEPPCQRCFRLGKNCVVSVPMSQKSRIAELEAKLEAVTKLLAAQTMNGGQSSLESAVSNINAPNPEPFALKSKKRRLDFLVSDEMVENEEEIPLIEGNGLEIDRVVSHELQIQCLIRYHTELDTVFPIPVLKNYDVLREKYPQTLQAVVFAACVGIVSWQQQDDITDIVLTLLTSMAKMKANYSIDLVQALLITVYWYRQPKDRIQVALHELSHLATEISKIIGLETYYGMSSTDSLGDEFGSVVGWRTRLLCDIMSATIASSFRVPHQIGWDTDYETKLCLLEYGKKGVDADPLVCQFLRGERLCEQITHEAGLVSDPDSLRPIADYATCRRLRNFVLDWKAQLPLAISCPRLTFYEHTANIYLHEYVLHTPTNKRSFAGPFVAERLSVTDFPTPVVTPEDITSIYNLRDACHSLLDTFIGFDVTTSIHLPVMIFAARALYAQWILIKLYIAATASGNTYGTFIDAQSFQVEQYLRKLCQIGQKIQALDDSCGSAKILMSPPRLSEWFSNYNASLLQQIPFALNMYPTVGSDFGNLSHQPSDPVDWTNFASNEAFDYGFEDLFGGVI